LEFSTNSPPFLQQQESQPGSNTNLAFFDDLPDDLQPGS
jgi:hypothetical protein